MDGFSCYKEKKQLLNFNKVYNKSARTMSYFLSNIFAVFSFVYQIEIIKMYGKVLLLIENNEETPFFWCSNSNIEFAEMNIKSIAPPEKCQKI